MPFYFKYMHCKKNYIYIYKLIYVYTCACFCFAHSFLCQTKKILNVRSSREMLKLFRVPMPFSPSRPSTGTHGADRQRAAEEKTLGMSEYSIIGICIC